MKKGWVIRVWAIKRTDCDLAIVDGYVRNDNIFIVRTVYKLQVLSCAKGFALLQCYTSVINVFVVCFGLNFLL